MVESDLPQIPYVYDVNTDENGWFGENKKATPRTTNGEIGGNIPPE